MNYRNVKIERIDNNTAKILVSTLFGTIYIDTEFESTKGHMKEDFRKFVSKSFWILSDSQKNLINKAIERFEELEANQNDLKLIYLERCHIITK